MCRKPFQPNEVTRIHLDQRSSSTSDSAPSHSPGTTSLSDPGSTLARELHDRINEFVAAGASTSVAHTLTKDCKSFFKDHTPGSHLDFYVTYQLLNHFLLGYYRAFFQDPAAADKSLYKFQAEVQAYHQSWETRYRKLTKDIEDLTEKLRLEVLAKENEVHERETSEAVARSLKDELQAQESWWHWKYEELRRKHSDLQGEVSELRGAQIPVIVSQCPTPPDFAMEKKEDARSKRTKENEPPLSLIIPPSAKDWNGRGASRRSAQPSTYDYATIEGCLSIISTPQVDECPLRDESEMKEMLSDLLTDPVPARRAFNPITHTNFDSPSSLRVPSSSKYLTPSYDSSHYHSTSTTAHTATAAASDSKSLAPVLSPDAPLWTRKRSVRAAPYSRDTKGKSTSVSRSHSASEAE